MIIGSNADLSPETLQCTAESDRCLTALSLGTASYLWTSANWAFACREKGGFTDDTTRDSAAFLLRCILEVFKESEPEASSLPVVVDNEWRCTWPVPTEWESLLVTANFNLKRCLTVDFSSLAMAQPRAKNTKRAWMRKLESIKKGAELECDLLDVIKHAHGDSALRGLSSHRSSTGWL